MPVIEPQNADDKIAIYAVDPGTVSAVARGIFPAHPDSVWEGLAAGWHESWECRGEPAEQAWEIIPEYADWIGWPGCANMKMKGVVRWYLVFEDFVIRLGEGAASKRDLLDPVRVTYACDSLCITREGLRWAHPELQQASLAKSFATNDRLRRHGMWVKGSEHRRDATRHLCRKYATIVGEE